jgi:hypothetical protein
MEHKMRPPVGLPLVVAFEQPVERDLSPSPAAATSASTRFFVASLSHSPTTSSRQPGSSAALAAIASTSVVTPFATPTLPTYRNRASPLGKAWPTHPPGGSSMPLETTIVLPSPRVQRRGDRAAEHPDAVQPTQEPAGVACDR